jgi:hypothetical protein
MTRILALKFIGFLNLIVELHFDLNNSLHLSITTILNIKKAPRYKGAPIIN